MTHNDTHDSHRLLAVTGEQGGARDAVCHSPGVCSSPVPTPGEWCPTCQADLELERGLKAWIGSYYRSGGARG